MVNFQYKKLLLACGALSMLALSGCGGSKPIKFKTEPLNNFSAHASQTQNNVNVKVRKLNKKDCVSIFGKTNGQSLCGKKGFQPIQLSISNQSNKTLRLNKKDIGLKLVDSNRIAQKLKKNTAVETIGIAILSVPLAVGAMYLSAPLAALFGAAIYLPKTILLLSIGAGTFAGVNTYNAVHTVNNIAHEYEIDSTVKHTCASDVVEILPAQRKEFLLFVRHKNYSPTFDIALRNTNNLDDALTFNIQL